MVDKAQTYQTLRSTALQCARCHLAQTRTQVVFGEGALEALIMLVGQGPGRVEDQTGRPFVGPAGRLLDQALETVGLTRSELYVTNVIKCWAFQPVGGHRQDRPPTAAERKACAVWLAQEIQLVSPRIILCLGAPAAQAFLGSRFKMTADRGRWHLTPEGRWIIATYHPAYVLRLKNLDEAAYQQTWQAFLDDFRQVTAKAREFQR
ncbi:MAG: UdgX family uracil-DNA binding protein [Acidobacteria bacterium]|nr:UdgX family uracil-DNA binding protein [Acidobacteriota bacterium]MDW7983512.1 UdgX family uracil-DNA binding protein [Acidobacteriota bacterium]